MDIEDTKIEKKDTLTRAEQSRVLLALSIIFMAVAISGALIVAVNMWARNITH